MRAVAWKNTQAGIDRRRALARVEAPRREIVPETVQAQPAAVPASAEVIPFARPEVDRLAYLDAPTRRPARQIIDMVACWHDVPVRDILDDGRFKHIVEARYDAVAAVYLNCLRFNGEKWVRLSLSRLGAIFGKDHSTLHHALAKRGLK